ncbi:hypothetical protein [Streptomyces chumphonensis]|uniref:hypothetical protein n=1 Tax=Streptomyces chumphonensis TaxID=1214925 RepID=UPI003D710AD0
MDMQDTIRLLGVVSLADDRAVKTDPDEQRVQVQLWAVALRAVPYDFAVEAIGAHYASSAYPIMPKDIAERWRTFTRDRMRLHVGTFEPNVHPEVDPYDRYGDAYVAALRKERQELFTGAAAPTDVRAITSGCGQEPVPANDNFRQALAELRRRNRDNRAAVAR